MRGMLILTRSEIIKMAEKYLNSNTVGGYHNVIDVNLIVSHTGDRIEIKFEEKEEKTNES